MQTQDLVLTTPEEEIILKPLKYDLEDDEFVIMNRNEQIRELGKEVNQLAEIFKDIYELVNKQGDDLILVEENIEEAKVQAERGHEELVQAAKYKNKAKYLSAILATMVTGPTVGVLFGLKLALITAPTAGLITYVVT